jgi:hypothetical protein
MQPGQKTYSEVRQLLLQIFERDMAWKTLPLTLARTFPLLSLVCLRWGEERRGEEKGETKETNGEKKEAKVEKVEKVDLEGGITIVTTPPARLCLLQLQQEGPLHNVLPSLTYCGGQREALEVQEREEEQRKGKGRRKEREQGKRIKERKGSKLPSFRCLT